MADAYKTRNQLIDRIAENLGVLVEGLALDAGDASKIDNLVDPSLALLAAREIYYVSNDEQIEVAAFLPLAVWIANQLVETYGIASDQAAILQAKAMAAEGDLKQISAPRRSRRTLKTPFITRAGAYYAPR
jgi:hypothetical protein